MSLISEDTPCEICDKPLLGERYTIIPGTWLLRRSRFARWERAPVHLECLAVWEHREEVARTCFIDDLAAHWCAPDDLLAISPGWFLAATPGQLVPLFNPDQPVWIPGRVSVHLAMWPSAFSSTWDEWSSYISGRFRHEMPASALDIVEAAMAAVRDVAPSVKALAALHAARPDPPPGGRSVTELGDFLATLWGEAAHEWDWELLEREHRKMLRAAAEESEAITERERRTADAVARSNEVARSLAADLAVGRALRCPHCGRSTHDMRFFDLAPRARSYFVCRRCGGSFAGREAATDE